MLRYNRLRWFRHVKQSELCTGQILDLEVKGYRSCGQPKKCSLDTNKDDLKLWGFQAETCQDRTEWRKRLKTAINIHA